jgi:hypothetical protein
MPEEDKPYYVNLEEFISMVRYVVLSTNPELGLAAPKSHPGDVATALTLAAESVAATLEWHIIRDRDLGGLPK